MLLHAALFNYTMSKISNYCIVLGSKFSRIAIFGNFVEIILRICCTHTLHGACQKFLLKYFHERLKIREIREIKDLQKKLALYRSTNNSLGTHS